MGRPHETHELKNEWKKNMVSPRPKESADYYGENIGNTGHFGKGPKGWERSDAKIEEEVSEVLLHSSLDASEIEVSVTGGIVSLSGKVSTSEDRWIVEDLLDDVAGIKEVKNRLKAQRR